MQSRAWAAAELLWPGDESKALLVMSAGVYLQRTIQHRDIFRSLLRGTAEEIEADVKPFDRTCERITFLSFKACVTNTLFKGCAA